MFAEAISSIREILSPGKKILITTHANPDGDAIGSSLALMHYLRKYEYDVQVAVPNDFPSFLAWMPGIDQILVYKRQGADILNLAREAHIMFCLDYNGLDRVEGMKPVFEASPAVRILIDHHPQPETASFDILLSETQTSSTSELMYEVITGLSGEQSIDKAIAECLFVGIATDTGTFSYACNREKTFLVVAALMRTGIDIERIHRLVYDTYSESRMRLLGHSLSERLKVFPLYSTAYIYLSKADLKEFSFQIGDTEGIVNYALSINGISLAALFTEKENRVRLSLRSKGTFSVNDFVRTHFEGGGHRNAAGGNSYLSLEETLRTFEELLPQYREALINSFLHESQ